MIEAINSIPDAEMCGGEDMGVSASPTGLSPTVEPASSLAGFAASIPNALREFGCTFSKCGSVVRIDCDNGDDANEVFDWLSTVVDTIADHEVVFAAEDHDADWAAIEGACNAKRGRDAIAALWQPIETAPKDGRRLLFAWPRQGGRRLHGPMFHAVGYWQAWPDYADRFEEPGMWASVLGAQHIYPTLWMPLP